MTIFFSAEDNDLSHIQCQAIIWTNVDYTIGEKFSKILIEIETFPSKKIDLKLLSGKWQLFCLCSNALT